MSSESVTSKVAVGAVWSFLARWGVRLLGLLSTVVLARILEPEDFGLMAMALVFTGLLNAFLSMEFESALIRLPSIEESHFHTSWTLSFLIGLIISAAVFLGAPYVAEYYQEEKVKTVLQWLSLSSLIAGLRSPKIALFRREFEFNKDFILQTSIKLFSVIFTVLLAVYYRDYRALVIGVVVSSALNVIVGYIMAPYVPSFSLEKKRDLFSFSIWLAVRNVAQVALFRIEQLFIGSNYGAQKASYYYLGNEVSNMISAEMALPIGRALLPGFSETQNDKDRTLEILRLSFAAVLLVLPVCFGLAVLSEQFVEVVFGSKWGDVAPVLSVLAIGGAFSALIAPFEPLMLARGEAKSVALVKILSALLLVGAVFFVIDLGSLVLIAWMRVSIFVLAFMLMVYLSIHMYRREMISVFFQALRVLISSVAMYAFIEVGMSHFSFSPFFALVFWSLLGGLFFLVTMFSIWLTFRRPFGLESVISDFLVGLIRSRKGVL